VAGALSCIPSVLIFLCGRCRHGPAVYTGGHHGYAAQHITRIKEFELPLVNNPDAAARLVEKIDECIHDSGIPQENIVGIGIGMPGFVDAEERGELFFFGNR